MTSEAALFQHIPSTLFRSLASRGAPVYSDILLALFTEAVQRHQPFSRDYALNIVRQRLLEQGAVEQTEDALEDDTPSGDLRADEDLISIRAFIILRHLEKCGWLKPDNLADYSQVYSLPESRPSWSDQRKLAGTDRALRTGRCVATARAAPSSVGYFFKNE